MKIIIDDDGIMHKVYTKADMVAMLTELKKEIDETPINSNTSERFKLGQATAYDKCEFLIQQKIDALKKVVEE